MVSHQFDARLHTGHLKKWAICGVMRAYRSLRGGFDARFGEAILCEETSRAAAQPLRRRQAPVSSGAPARQEAGPPAKLDPPRSEAPLGRVAGAYARARGLLQNPRPPSAAGAGPGCYNDCDAAARQETRDVEISEPRRSWSD